jgi:peptidoglycan/xylan/chitin deacetylase (PgdA/CDA1 family)
VILALLLAVEMAVTVDDLPAHGPEYPGIDRLAIARQILQVFRKHRMSPVYGFVNGRRLETRPELGAILDAWHAAGNPLGNHGYSHLSLTETAVPEYLADIERNEPVLRKYGDFHFYRYPFLFEGETAGKRDAVRAWLEDHHYRIAEVTLDFDDWAYNPPFARCTARNDLVTLGTARKQYLDAAMIYLQAYQEIAQLVAGREVRHILLLHIGAMDADQMDALLTSYEEAGVKWISLEKALEDPLYAQDHGQATKAGSNLLDKLMRAKKIPSPKFPAPDEKWLEKVCR